MKPSRIAFEHHWVKTRGKRARNDLQRHPAQPQTYISDAANRHWVTWQAAQPKEPEKEPVAKVVSTAPERIWLDLGFAPSDEDEISFNDLVDATWSHDNATGFGIEYVRADIAAHGFKENTCQ